MKAEISEASHDLDSRTVLSQNAAQDALWDEYVSRFEEGTLYFSRKWDRVLSVYGLEVLRLMVLRGEVVVGVLPLVSQKSPFLGNRLISLPWFDAAGIVADDQEACSALLDKAIHEMKRRAIGELQIRQRESLDESCNVRLDKLLMRLTLTPDPQTLWNSFKPKVRNQVRKAEKSGLIVDSGGSDFLLDYYDVYSENMRDLGSPSHSYRFFESVLENFGNETKIYLVKLDGDTIGAGWTMSNGCTLEIPWASSRRCFNKYCVNHIMYWQIIQDACREGFRWFHFGRSTKDSGQFNFKRQWGAEPVQLFWHYMTPQSGAYDQIDWRTSPTLKYGTQLWKRLPLGISRAMGPLLIRYLP